MPYITVKREMTLPELIKWACVNGITNKRYVGNKGGEVYFDGLRRFRTSGEVYPEETFEVEVEEEITEETMIYRLLEVRNAIPSKETEWKDLKIFKSYLYGNHSISEIKNEYSVAIYMLNDDMTLSLIWKEGRLID